MRTTSMDELAEFMEVLEFQEKRSLAGEVSSLAAGPPSPTLFDPPSVRWVQAALNAVLPDQLSVDGVLGPRTSGAVQRFQARSGLAPDGIPGPQTRKALTASLAGQAGSGPQALSGGPGVFTRLRDPEILDDFDFDRDSTKPVHEGRLAQIALCIRSTQGGPAAITRVRIVGHTDAEGTPDYNRALGLRRAERAAAGLRAALPGLERTVVVTPETRGEEALISPIPQRNRRVEIFFKRPVPVLPPLPPRPARRTVDLRIVVKSFIAPIGSRISRIGSLPFIPCDLPPNPLGVPRSVRLALLAAALDRSPGATTGLPAVDARDQNYRLFSAMTVRVVCDASGLVSATPLRPSPDTHAGKECADLPVFGVQCRTGSIKVTGLSSTPAGAGRVLIGWEAGGEPHPVVEPGFLAVCPRASRTIWHRVGVAIECTAAGLRLALELQGSAFPSHALYINGSNRIHVPQGVLSHLWTSDPASGRSTHVVPGRAASTSLTI